MGFSIETTVPALTVFVQGLISFFSPCVLPLVPLYVSYLAGGARSVDEAGNIRYPRKKVLINTLFFVLGVSFAFFLLGFGFTALGQFFRNNRIWFARLSGIIMILFGLYQLGIFGQSKTLSGEHRLPFRLDKWSMGPAPALLLGFTFSFAWTPCVGPTLGSVLLMAGSSGSAMWSGVLIGVYTLGFVLPFLAVGLFTGTVLDFFKKHQNVVRYTVKIGAALLILMGIMTLTGFMNGITGYLSDFGGSNQNAVGESAQQESGTVDGAADGTGNSQAGEGSRESGAESGGASSASQTDPAVESGGASGAAQTDPAADGGSAGTERQDGAQKEYAVIPAPDFTLTDQYGNEHKLSDYKGKTVFLNFWATWCGPCRSEMPEIQKLYESYGKNEEELIVLGVAGPNQGYEGSTEDIKDFLTENGYTFPVVMDEDGLAFAQYGIRAFPTTFMIDRDGNVFGYLETAMTGDIMESIVQQTMDGVRR